jgi:UDP-2,3-diacylglucosamine pyrophosphatase LpxH
MLTANDVIVLSDVHLAKKKGGTGQELFQADEALERFLTWTLRNTRNTLVVLNGDIFDFLVVPEGYQYKLAVEGFGHLQERTDAIIKDHPGVFNSLAKLTQSRHHQLAFTGGNHDPELAFPVVQQAIEKRLASPGCSNEIPVRWLVHGEALSVHVGEARVLVEHGDVLDEWNRINRDALRSAVGLASRGILENHKYTTPPGTEIVVKYIDRLRKNYPWVEMLKPETEAVPWLLLHIIPLNELDEYVGVIERKVKVTGSGYLTDIRETYFDEAARYRAVSPRALARGVLSVRDSFGNMVNELRRKEIRLLTKKALIKKLRRIARTNTFFNVEELDAAIYDNLAFLILKGADLLVHGHTHSAKANRIRVTTKDGHRDGLYLNSGTWARLMVLPKHDDEEEVWSLFVDGLKRGEAASFERHTFVRVRFDDRKTTASLCEWKDGGPETLAVYRFVPEQQVWEKEMG